VPSARNYAAADVEHSAAVILYSLTREAGSPYHPPHGSVIQLHVEKSTWHAARTWFNNINLSPFPPPPPLVDPGLTDDDPQTITPSALDFLAAQLHVGYEAAAIQTGWSTNPTSRTDWHSLPAANRETMLRALTHMLTFLGIEVAPAPENEQPLVSTSTTTPTPISAIIPP